MPTSYEKLLIGRLLLPGVGGRLALLIAGIGCAGVAIGVASLVLVVSFLNGAQARLAGQIASADGHVFITGRDQRVTDPVRLERELLAIKGVRSATASVNATGMVTANGASFGADLQGLARSRMRASPPFRGGGAMLIGVPPTRPGTLALGSGLASRLGVGVGGHAALSVVWFERDSLTIDQHDFLVSGVVTVDDDERFNNGRVIVPADDLGDILGTRNLTSKVSVTIGDLAHQAAVIAAIRAQLGSAFVITTWKEMNKALFDALKQERVAMILAVSLVTIIALSNIMSSMILLVRHKAREIAMLRTMGVSTLSVARVFVGVGAIIGLAGEAAGLGIGLLLKAIKDPVAAVVRARLDQPSMALDVLSSLPLAITAWEIGWIVALVSAGVLVSTLYPAMRAAAIDPAAALRLD